MNTNEGMTIKEIAELCNVSEQTVINWAWKAAAQAAKESGPEIRPEDTAIGRKLKEAGHGKPALLEIDMLLDAIRAGGRKSMADLLSENAARTAALPEPEKQLMVPSSVGSKDLALKVQAMGGPQQVLTYALMGRVYQLFANYREVDVKSIFHIMELARQKASSPSVLHGKDVARAVRDATHRSR